MPDGVSNGVPHLSGRLRSERVSCHFATDNRPLSTKKESLYCISKKVTVLRMVQGAREARTHNFTIDGSDQTMIALEASLIVRDRRDGSDEAGPMQAAGPQFSKEQESRTLPISKQPQASWRPTLSRHSKTAFASVLQDHAKHSRQQRYGMSETIPSRRGA